MVVARNEKDDETISRGSLVVECFPCNVKDEAPPTLLERSARVNSWPKDNSCVEAARPSHCGGCGAAARQGDRLRLHGHGQRQRCSWGPPAPEAEPETREVTVRRYRCLECGATMSVSPRGFARGYRYSLPAIAAALLSWAVWRWPSSTVRERTSPLPNVGLNRLQRWRSLIRWTRVAERVFAIPQACAQAVMTHRQVAQRIALLLVAGGPPGHPEQERVFIAAQGT